MRSTLALILVGCMCLILAPAAAEPCQVWQVPGDFDTLPQALQSVQPGDTIELAMGRHKITGGGHLLMADLTIRCRDALPGACVLEESATYPGEWRDAPVFTLDQPGAPCRFEGITFRNWNLADGPYQFISNPIFHVMSGTLEMIDCQFQDFYKYALYFSGGQGLIENCEFAHGAGCPSAISFGGDDLIVRDTVFHHNTWIYDCDQYMGSIIHLRSGTAHVENCDFYDNGPLVHMIRVERAGTLFGDQFCLGCNATMWEARVEGHAYLTCCEICCSMWQVCNGGELVMIDVPDRAGKAMATESATWSDVKSLFD